MFLTKEPLFPGGNPTSLPDAARVAKHPLYLPARLPRALGDERPEAWIVDRQVGIRYSSGSESGLVVDYGLWPPGGDPASSYKGIVRESGGGETTPIQGWPGLVIPASAAGPQEPPVSIVAVTLDRTEVRLYGRVPIQDLVEVAESLQRVPPP
jgi:hypothetical protein